MVGLGERELQFWFHLKRMSVFRIFRDRSSEIKPVKVNGCSPCTCIEYARVQAITKASAFLQVARYHRMLSTHFNLKNSTFPSQLLKRVRFYKQSNRLLLQLRKCASLGFTFRNKRSRMKERPRSASHTFIDFQWLNIPAITLGNDEPRNLSPKIIFICENITVVAAAEQKPEITGPEISSTKNPMNQL